eukprot:187782_1
MKNLGSAVLINSSSKQQLIKSPDTSSHISPTHPSRLDRHDISRRYNKDIKREDSNNEEALIPMSLNIKKTPIKNQMNDTTDRLDTKKMKVLRNDINNVSLFGIDLSHLPPYCQGIVLTVIILFGFISIGYVEEGFKFEFANFSFGWFMTAVELIIFSIFAMIERLFKSLSSITSAVYLSSASTMNLTFPNEKSTLDTETVCLIQNTDSINPELHKSKKSNGPLCHPCNDSVKSHDDVLNLNSNSSKILKLFSINWFHVIFEKQMHIKYHLMVSWAMMCSRALTNIALLLLNYPTQVIFKSMKLISVMIGSVCCLKKEYHQCEYIGAPLLVASAVLFTFGDSNDLNFNVLGIVVVLLSLLFDAIHANSQQYILQAKTERDTTMELLVYSNLIAGVLAGVVSLLTGEIDDMFHQYLPQQPDNTLYKLFMWFLIRVACLYIGVSAFVVFTKRFGAVFAVTITTVRKILTVLLSYVFYPGKKAFIPIQHGTGTALFVLSLSLWGYGTVKKKETNKSRR